LGQIYGYGKGTENEASPKGIVLYVAIMHAEGFSILAAVYQVTGQNAK
jgi:hypothetical protein